MKVFEKKARDYVLNEVDPSDYVELAPDILAINIYQAAYRQAIEDAAKELETYGLQLFREADSYLLRRARVVLAAFAVKIRALADCTNGKVDK